MARVCGLGAGFPLKIVITAQAARLGICAKSNCFALSQGTPMKTSRLLLAIAAPALLCGSPVFAQDDHDILTHAHSASEHAHVLAETTDESFEPLKRLIDQAHDMIEEALDLARAGNSAEAKDEMIDAVLTLEAVHALSEAIEVGATSTHRFAEEAHMLVEKAVKANAAELARDRNDGHLKAEAAEIAIADKEAGHADEEAESAEKAARQAHQASERALAAAKSAAGASGAALLSAISSAHDATEAADKLIWAAEHSAHDIHNSSERAHEAITSAHNISETVTLIEMGEHQK